MRKVDTVARIGSDEFLVLVEDIDFSGMKDAAKIAADIAENIRASLSAPYQLKDKTHQGSCSIGVSLICGNNASADELIKQAEMAMHRAKESGRNAVRFFEPKK